MTEPSEGDEGAPVVALDVGGTQIKGGVLAEDGTLVQSERRPTRAERGPDAVLDTVLAFAADLTERYRPAAAASGSSDAYAGAEALRAAGARAVVASLGPDGMIAVTPHGSWRPAPPAALAGNPTGAGTRRSRPWPSAWSRRPRGRSGSPRRWRCPPPPSPPRSPVTSTPHSTAACCRKWPSNRSALVKEGPHVADRYR